MMRTLWIAISTIALANLMALVGFTLWLNATGRLSKDRVEKVRLIFQPTVAQDAAVAAAEQVKAAQAGKEAEDQARDKRPPVTAEQRLAIIREYEEGQRQKNERVQRETQDLLNQLELRRAEFDKARQMFVAERDAFNATREQIAKSGSDAQLAKTLKVYESVKPADAAAMMETILNAGGSSGRDQVVAYLNQMQPRTSSRIVAEFNKKDPVLAANLLERLRTYGLESRRPGDSPANSSSQAPPDAKSSAASP